MLKTEDLRRRVEEEGAEILRIMGERFPLFTDILESDEEILVIVDMAGCIKQTIDIEYEERKDSPGGVLRLEGRREKPIEKGFRYVAEARPDFTSGEIPIDHDIEYEESTATYKDGILKIHLKKK